MKQHRSKRVTLADVAARAGVSIATASVAITGRPSGNCRVSPAVAEKIRAAATDLRYRPNLHARNLSTRRTRTIAILIKRPAWQNATFYISAAQRVLRERGYIEMLMLEPESTIESERQSLELAVERQVEGIMVIPLIDLQGRTNIEHFDRVQRDDGIPIVQLQLALPGFSAPGIVVDEVGGFHKAVTLLHAMGHQHIALVTTSGYDNPDPFNPYTVAHQRYVGYRKAMAELGLREQVFAPQERAGPGDTAIFDQFISVAPRIANAHPHPTAALCFSDHCAAGLMTGLRQAGIRRPHDMSIIGVGDQLFGRMLDPKLTVLTPPFEQMAEAAVQMLLNMIDGAAGVSQSILPTLLMRDSVRELSA